MANVKMEVLKKEYFDAKVKEINDNTDKLSESLSEHDERIKTLEAGETIITDSMKTSLYNLLNGGTDLESFATAWGINTTT